MTDGKNIIIIRPASCTAEFKGLVKYRVYTLKCERKSVLPL